MPKPLYTFNDYTSPYRAGVNGTGYGVAEPGHQDSAQSSGGSGVGFASIFNSVMNEALNYWKFNESMAFNRAEAGKARAFNSSEAAKERAFNRAEAAYANRQNTPGSQVAMAKAAGLSPGVLYGQMSPSTAQPATGAGAASGVAASSPSAPQSQLDSGVDAYLKSVELQNEQQLQQSQIGKLDIERLAVEIDNMSAHQRNIAELELKLSSGQFNKDQSMRLRQMLELEKQQLAQSIENIKASTSNLNASTDYISGTQTDLGKSEIGLNKARIRTEGTVQSLNTAKTATETSIKELNEQHERLMAVQSQEIDNLNIVFRDKYYSIRETLINNDIDPRYAPFVMDFVHDTAPDIAGQGVRTLLSWFQGDTWINAFSRWLASKNIARANTYGHVIQDEKKN